MLEKKSDPLAARALMDKACALGDHWEFLYQRAMMSSSAKDDAKALEDVNRALSLRPKQIDCLLLRAHVLLNEGKYAEAAADYLYAARVEPTESHVRSIYDRIVKGLVYQGWEEHKAGHLAEAVRIFDSAADLAPNNREVQQRKVVAMMGGKKPEPSDVEKYEAAVEASPDDLTLRRQLDYSIAMTSRQFDKIVASWTDYIGRHPSEGRAMVERGGAYLKLGKRAEARQDFQKACELGLSEGCGLLNNLQ